MILETSHLKLSLWSLLPVIEPNFCSRQLGAGADLGRTMWGMLGVGAFGFQLQEVLGERRIVTTTRSHSNKQVTDCVNAMEPHEVIRVGGAGNKVRWI